MLYMDLCSYLITLNQILLLILLPSGGTTVSTEAEELYMASCRTDLGMNSGQIEDSSITASSSYDKKSVGPHNSRIRTEKNGGAWCPKQQIGKHTYEWLEVDLNDLFVLSMVETQGRFGNGQGQEFAPYYFIEYQRESGDRWLRFRDLKGVELVEGNVNTFLAELRELHPPIIARRLRFIPYANHPRTVCMRVEIYGCPWKDGTISYSMRQGDRRGADMDFHDFTYDGSVVDGYLSGGLGQLTDLDEGDSNFRLDLKEIGKKGYEWLAWKNEGTSSEPLEIIFQFDSVRNFSSLIVTANNAFNREVSVFREARVQFSVGGERYGGEDVVFKYLRDTALQADRRVTIPLGYRIGRYVKISFYFDMKWMMISEIRFVGERVLSNIPVELPLNTKISYLDSSVESKQRKKHLVTSNVTVADAPFSIKPPVQSASEDLSTEGSVSSTRVRLSDTYIGIIIGTLSAFILLMIFIGCLILLRYRRRKNPGGNPKLKSTLHADRVQLSLGDFDPTHVMTYSRKTTGSEYRTMTSSEETEKDLAMHQMTRSRLIPNDHSFSNDQTFQLRPDKIGAAATDDNAAVLLLPNSQHNGGLALVNSNGQAFHHPVHPQATNPHRGAVHPMYPDSREIGHQVLYSRPIQGTLVRRRAASPDQEPPIIPPTSVNSSEKLPLNLQHLLLKETELKHIMKLGEGVFGEVNLAELRISDDDIIDNKEKSLQGPVLVAVKLLQKPASHIRLQFYSEIDLMLTLEDSNIAQVVGICRIRDCPSVVVEYLRGNLHQYLQRAVQDDSPETSSPGHSPRLSYGCLIYMATQIASGMKMLESLNLVHRDLAARNCLIGQRYLVKISDYGVSHILYPADYYKVDGLAPLPIRWMAWEAVILNKFTCKTDVWSFAVTLWEILTLAREQPFSTLTNEQILEVCSYRYRDISEHETYLSQPDNCPKEIYDLMMECWHQDDAKRPTFREIHMFLQRKNMGYNPADEQNVLLDTSFRTTLIT